MKHLVDIAMEDGFQLVRGRYMDFSSMRPNGVDMLLTKGDKSIIFGLHEKDKPPTLIYPRPNAIFDTLGLKVKMFHCGTDETSLVSFDYVNDDVMNRILQTFSHEEIYNNLFNNSTFNLNNNTIQNENHSNR